MSRTATSRITTFLYILRLVCCSMLQCVAVCCGVLQCVAVCCSVLQCAAVCCSTTRCNTLQHKLYIPCRERTNNPHPIILRKVCCSMLQCVAVCCSVLQCVAVYINSTFSVEREPTTRTPSRENLHPDARET